MLDAENPAENVDPSASGPDAANSVPTDTTPDTTTDQHDEAAPVTGDETAEADTAVPAKKATAKRSAAKKTTTKKVAKKTTAKRTTKKAAFPADGDGQSEGTAQVGPGSDESAAGTAQAASATEDVAPGARDEAETAPVDGDEAQTAPPAKKTAKKTAKKAAGKRAAKAATATSESSEGQGAAAVQATVAPAEVPQPVGEAPEDEEAPAEGGQQEGSQPASPVSATALLFQPPDPTKAVVTRRRRATRPEAPAVAEPGEEAAPTEHAEGEQPEKPVRKGTKKSAKARSEEAAETTEAEPPKEQPAEEGDRAEGDEQGGERRRRRRGGRRRRRSGGGEDNGSTETAESEAAADQDTSEQEAEADEGEETTPSGSRRRRRRRRSGESGEGNGEEAEGTSARARRPRNAEDEITAVTGSTRLEAKKQRRREGREAGRRRAPIVSEAEFLARRESVDRVMVIRQRKDLTQIAVLEDKVLVEHYVSRESQTSLIGNVYLGRVQNVLPSMEAAFIDIGKGRNAVLYAGEVNWDALGAKNGQPRKIESVLKSGQTVLVQVTKDPVGHKGARLTSQISLPGRFLVYVPDGTTSGISRKLPDTERNRLKNLLKEIVPDTAGVIVRTAAEGASEDELTRDVERLRARWEDIERKAATGNAPQLLYGEPDLTLKVVRDLFTEDFNKLVISGDEAWEMVEGYVTHVAPDLADRLEKYDGERDVFAAYRIDEQIEKALDRKVWLPSGGSLVIDRTEAMTVVDVNTGKFTGSGGNLEETVTKNNLEAAEEIVRQLRLRDIGGIIVVDFIDMVLESNRDLVLRRLVECLGRDRTRHQVAEVTSLGLVQMTRKRIGTGLLEAFSESCEHCQGRGLLLHHEPVEPKKKAEEESRRGRRGGRGRGRDEAAAGQGGIPSPKDVAAMAKHEEKPDEATPSAEKPAEVATGEETAQEPAEKEKPAETAAAEEPRAEMPEGVPAGSEPASPDGDGEAAGVVETRPSGRSRGGRGGGRGRRETAPAETAPTEAAPETGAGAPAGDVQQTPDAGPEPSGEPADDRSPAPGGAEEAPAEAGPSGGAAAAPAPTVVTTVRRRSARRPAGPPSADVDGVPSDTAVSSSPAITASVAVDERPDEGAEEPADVDPIATLVDAAEEPASAEANGSDGAGAEGPGTPHVPVKKRGRRR